MWTDLTWQMTPSYRAVWGSNKKMHVLSICYKVPYTRWFKQQKCVVLWFWGIEVSEEGVSKIGSSWGLWRTDLFMPLSLYLAVSSLCLHPIFSLWICLSPPNFYFFARPPVNGFSAHPTPVWHHLNWLHLKWSYFQINSHAEVQRVRT